MDTTMSLRAGMGVFAIGLFAVFEAGCAGDAPDSASPPAHHATPVDAGASADDDDGDDAATPPVEHDDAAPPASEVADAAPEGGLPPFVATGTAITAPEGTWTWVPFPDTSCRDGSSAGIAVSLKSASSKLVIFVQGGGACFDAVTCAVNPANTGGPQ